MSNVVGSLVVNMSARTAQFSSGMQKMKADVNDFSKHIEGIAGKIGGEGFGKIMGGLTGPAGLAGLAGAFSLKKMIGDFQEAALRMADMRKHARNLGTDLSTFMGWQRAAKAAGLEVDAVEGALRRLESTISQANSGSKEQAQVLRDLGLSANELSRMSPDEALKRTAQAIMQIENPMRRARVEMELFGKTGAQLDPALKKIAQGTQSRTPAWAANALADFGEGWKEAKATAAGIKDTALGAVAWILGTLSTGRFHKAEEKPPPPGEDPERLKAALAAPQAALQGLEKQIESTWTPLEQFYASMNENAPTIGAAKIRELTAEFQRLSVILSTRKVSQEIQKMAAEFQRGGLSAGQAWAKATLDANPFTNRDTREKIANTADWIDQVKTPMEALRSLTKGWKADLMDTGTAGQHLAAVMKATAGLDKSKLTGRQMREYQDALAAAQRLDRGDLAKKVKGEIEQLTETPLEKFQKQMKEFREGFAQGVISPEQFAKGADALRERAIKEIAGTEPHLAGAAVKGTVEAYSALAEWRLGGQTKDLAREQLSALEKQLEIQQQIADNTRTQIVGATIE